jgi:hypothetical protein
MCDDDAQSIMPTINPILSSIEDFKNETITVSVPGVKGTEPRVSKETVEDVHAAAQAHATELEAQVHRLKREELRAVILMAIVLNFKDPCIRKRVIEGVHSHLLNKHRILEYVVAHHILPLSAVKDDLRLLELDKQVVLDQIDETLQSVPGLKRSKTSSSREGRRT